MKRLVCPCGAPVTVQRSAPASDESADQHDGPVQPKVMPCGACGRLLVVDDPNVGRVVQGKWRLVRRLGQGGMGTVYLALETSVDREVALKFLHRHLAEREEYRTRFEQEARIMARVEHPNLAGLYSVERDGSVPFLVMKFVRGQPLSRLMRDKKVLTLEETLPLTVQMAAALSALHARGYVHRDLKPGNVMVSDEGHVTLLDFGLTRTYDQNLTRPGVALGSPQYMSPEQVLAGSLDARSDLYSLGLLTSELLVGHRPYRDEHTKAMLLQHLHDAPEPPHLANDKVPEAVSMVLLKALSKKAADRQPTVEAFVEALVTAANVGPVKLPARETAEAMLAAVSRPSPAPESLPDAEVAEVVSHETLSAPVPIASEPALTPRNLPELSATVSDLPPSVTAPPGKLALGAAVDQRTEVVPAWHEKTEAVPAWPDTESVVQVTAPAPRYSDEVTAPLVPGVRVGRKPDAATRPLQEAAVEGVAWPLKVSLVGLLLVIVLAAWVLLT
ncbi:MAG: protein kinase [Myxococcales bacterium]|nr:protein kinase [Myxococcales bacterium]